MIELFLPTITATLAAIMVALGARGERRRLESSLAQRETQIRELWRILEAKVAPAEFAAYVNRDDYRSPDWLFSEDGLVRVAAEDDDD